ncbi:MAG: class II glutamine amidotransferase [Planctomycetota bacterium]
MQSELLAISADAAATPRVDLHLYPVEHAPPASWGVAWYPSDDPNASFMKDTRFRGDVCINTTLPSHERLKTSVLVAHSRSETKRETRCDAQPFRRPFGRADCVFAHAGDLNLYPVSDAEQDDWTNPVFPAASEPVGSTDSERIFCRVLQRLLAAGASSISGLGWETLHGWFLEANRHGELCTLLSDGQNVIAYRDASGTQAMSRLRWMPPRSDQFLACGNATVTLDAGEDAARTLLVFASRPGPADGWQELAPGEMIVARNGDVVWSSTGNAAHASGAAPTQREIVDVRSAQSMETLAVEPGTGSGAAPPAASPPPIPRTLVVEHDTNYVYETPVDTSQHVIRLQPVHDHAQGIIEHSLEIIPGGSQMEFEDVFGNRSVRLQMKEPYGELRIRMRSVVQIRWPALLHMPHQRRSLPLTWMPWQRQMMHAYLLPPELPETQLREISEYATSFAERRDYDVVETLTDINTSIHRDFAYVSGSTTNETTPFEVYSTREGVCQDFANLFICMARLLGIPARYRVGYIYTGSDYDNTIQSDATHAWAEAYLPHIGWRGFDPTNGSLAGPDHIRVAVGRNFRDATPTSGTIFKGGGGETLTINVKVHELG